MAKFSIITSFLGKTKDRFHEYNENRSLDAKFQMVSEIQGVDGVEVVYPYEVNDPDLLRTLLDKYNLNISAINVNVKAEPEFRNGGLTSTEKSVREKALQFIKGAKEFAKEVGADKVTCCPLGDGYEFNFHCDYTQMWHYLVDAFGRASDYLPDMPLFIEYKPAETRGRCFIDSATKTLCLLKEIGNRSMGITIDFGHSVWGGENPAETLSIVHAGGHPYYIHINDNDGKWDWDYMVGTHHFIDYVEFLFYLDEFGYNDYYTSDTSPTRWDIKGTFEANARITNKILDVLHSFDKEQFKKLISTRDYLETLKFMEENIFSLKN